MFDFSVDQYLEKGGDRGGDRLGITSYIAFGQIRRCIMLLIIRNLFSLPLDS